MAKLSASGERCISCGSVAWINVHHLNYRNLYDCDIEDLAVLCEGCHVGLHRALDWKGQKAHQVREGEIADLINEYNAGRTALTCKDLLKLL